MSRFLFIKIIDSTVEKLGYNEHPFITSSFLCIFFLFATGPNVADMCILIEEIFYSLFKNSAFFKNLLLNCNSFRCAVFPVFLLCVP